MRETLTVSETIAANLKFHRERRGLNKAELARRAKTRRLTVVRAELPKGGHIPATETLQKLAQALHIAIDDFFAVPAKRKAVRQ